MMMMFWGTLATNNNGPHWLSLYKKKFLKISSLVFGRWKVWSDVSVRGFWVSVEHDEVGVECKSVFMSSHALTLLFIWCHCKNTDRVLDLLISTKAFWCFSVSWVIISLQSSISMTDAQFTFRWIWETDYEQTQTFLQFRQTQKHKMTSDWSSRSVYCV